MNSNSIVLSIITVAYNNLNDVLNMISSLYEFNDIEEKIEIIVVDHSEKSILNNLKDVYPEVITVQQDNLGFGAGNNCGALIAKGEFLLFINPDTIFIEPVFKEVIRTFQEDEAIGIVGVQLLDKNYKKNFSFYYIDKNSFFYKQKIKYANRKSYFDSDSMYISGANIFIKKRVFDKAGKFDENMFMYYEEPDLTKRIKTLGYNSKFLKELSIIHLEGVHTTQSLSVMKRKYASARYYCNKYGLNYKKILKQDYRYNVLKYYIAKIAGKNSDKCIEKCIYISGLLKKEM